MTDDDMRNEKLSMITNIKILLQLKKRFIYISADWTQSRDILSTKTNKRMLNSMLNGLIPPLTSNPLPIKDH